MSDQIFVDALGGILVTGGTVRLDFMALPPGNTDGASPSKLEFQQRVIMPVDAFLRAAAQIQEAVQALSRASAGTTQPPRPVPPNPPDAGKAPFP